MCSLGGEARKLARDVVNVALKETRVGREAIESLNHIGALNVRAELGFGVRVVLDCSEDEHVGVAVEGVTNDGVGLLGDTILRLVATLVVEELSHNVDELALAENTVAFGVAKGAANFHLARLEAAELATLNDFLLFRFRSFGFGFMRGRTHRRDEAVEGLVLGNEIVNGVHLGQRDSGRHGCAFFKKKKN